MKKITNVSGILKVGKIGHNSYGYSINNWSSPNNGKNSSFYPTMELETLANWGGGLVIRFRDNNHLSLYPQFCKLIIDGSLVYVGKKNIRTGPNWFSYKSFPEGNYSSEKLFNKENLGKSYSINLEFFENL